LKRLILLVAVVVLAGRAGGGVLPGFRVEKVADVGGFATSIVTDSRGAIYYTTTAGVVGRVGGGQIAKVTTQGVGNSGLLGMALIDDHSAIIHYTRPNQTYDVVSRIDLDSGAETVIHEFAGDIEMPDRGIAPEHHGGNPIVVDDGTIYVAIGDYGAVQIAEARAWNGGKIFRIDRDGDVTQIARGFRNPFDLAWDPERRRLIVPDNGDSVDDEINIITEGGFYGWPYTMGSEPSVTGAIAPVYVFPQIVAPTGIARLTGRNAILNHGYLLGAYVGKAIYFIGDIDAPHPIAIVSSDVGPIIDITEGPHGEIYFTNGIAIYRLLTPLRGDCNGDGVIDIGDIGALERELPDGDPHDAHLAHDGLYSGSWGCDADGDGLITSSDRGALWRLLTNRFPAIRRR
jgi:hypothetical protein